MENGRWFNLLDKHFDKLLVLIVLAGMAAFRTNHAGMISPEQTAIVVGVFLNMLRGSSDKGEK